jgi:hypothetical protein
MNDTMIEAMETAISSPPNDALWREHFITNRIGRLIHGGFWPPPIGCCTDLLSDALMSGRRRISLSR